MDLNTYLWNEKKELIRSNLAMLHRQEQDLLHERSNVNRALYALRIRIHELQDVVKDLQENPEYTVPDTKACVGSPPPPLWQLGDT